MAWLSGWKGYRVGGVEHEGGEQPRIWISLALASIGEMICEGCGGPVRALHDIVYRQVRDLPILEAATWLVVPRRRVAGPRCGPRLERLSWLVGRYALVTWRLAESVARLCAILPIKQVAAFFGLSGGTVKAIDKHDLEAALGPIELSGVEAIAMDAFAIQKGHRYATVIIDPRVKKVLWVGRGRSQ